MDELKIGIIDVSSLAYDHMVYFIYIYIYIHVCYAKILYDRFKHLGELYSVRRERIFRKKY